MYIGDSMNNQKILFIYYNNEIKYLTNSNMDHKEWFLSLGGKDELYENLVRGFILDGKIVFFKGQDFRYDNEVMDVAKKNGLKMRKDLNNNSLVICCGILPGFPGQKWEPIMVLNDNELVDENKNTNISTEKSMPENNVNIGTILELKNDYTNEKYLKMGTILTSITLIFCILAKVILINTKHLDTSNFLEILLICIQIGFLLGTLYGYVKKKEYTKYLAIFASISVILSFDLLDIIIGIIYFVFSVDANYIKNILDKVNKLGKKITKKR